MNNEIKEIYLSSLDWTKTHDNMGGVIADCIFKNNMSYEEFEKLRNKAYFVLCNKDYITNLQEENNNLSRQIKIMENYFELIIDIGFDYDGYNKAESLKSLIDELVKLASLGRAANDTEPMYMSLDDKEKHYNILNEEIKEDK